MICHAHVMISAVHRIQNRSVIRRTALPGRISPHSQARTLSVRSGRLRFEPISGILTGAGVLFTALGRKLLRPRCASIQLFLGVGMIVRRVRAVNTAVDSENRIHDDRIAAAYGFRGGLVPGVTVYGYMTLPVLDHFGEEWLERGAMSVRLEAPGYDGEEVAIGTEGTDDGRAGTLLQGGR